MDTTGEVLTHLARALPGRLHTIPDGETGERDFFVFWQHQSFPIEVRGPTVKQVLNEPPAAKIFSLTLDHIRTTMYDDHAIASYTNFCELREQGKIPQHVRFRVCLPGIMNTIRATVDP